VVDSLKVLDLKWPIREADIQYGNRYVQFVPRAADAPQHIANVAVGSSANKRFTATIPLSDAMPDLVI
jgi:hypothetical protein